MQQQLLLKQTETTSSLCDPEMSLVCLSDFEAYAKEHLPKTTWDYYAAGADECCTRDDNLMAYKRIRLRPRMLRDVSVTDTRATIQGMEISFPIGIAPTAFHCMAWHDGEMSTARAAESMNTCYIASTYATCSLEEISAAAPNGFRWFQLYVYRNRKFSEQLVHRVEAHGFKAIVLTVDVPYTGKRRNDIRNNFKLPPHLKAKNLDGLFEDHTEAEVYGVPANSLDPSICWKDIYWLQSLTRLPIIIKGILTKEDAELAVEHGVQGIIVSNHGGRQLDGGPATAVEISPRSTGTLFSFPSFRMIPEIKLSTISEFGHLRWKINISRKKRTFWTNLDLIEKHCNQGK
ncbi:2-Hydroxyacid oxidase 2 isoform X3 [Scyliorhinus torazame]|uniref:2-Hydroxyacid oxidase 2 isoform X3 n=1 Tax=Scyliorhinus torazame TaxID=75743 RepID=UPI003B59121A